MPVIHPLESIRARKKFIRAAEFGYMVYGEGNYGEEFQGIKYSEFGQGNFGTQLYGDYLQLSGIYCVRRLLSGLGTVRLRYYRPTNPRTVPQQAKRSNFAAAVAAWQILTIEQKAVYNSRAVGQHLTGYNLYIKEVMSS